MKLTVESVETVDVDTIKPHPANPRQGKVAEIKTSLDTNGQYRPIVVQRSTGYILAGNHTYLAARDLGWSDIQVAWVDVDDEQAYRIMAADNRTADLGEYDSRLLAELLAELPDLAGTGYDEADLDDLRAALEEADEVFAQGDERPGTTGPILGDGVRVAENQTIASKAENYENKDVRSVILQYPGDTYVWVVEALTELMERYDVESNADVVLRLLQKETATEDGQ